MRTLVIGATAMCVALATPALAANVSGSYEGTVASDSGLGLIGLPFRFDFTYDDATVGAPSGNTTVYTGPLLSATVTIGTNVWTFNPGSGDSTFRLNNDDVITFAIGTEDRVSMLTSDYTGPDFGTGATGSGAFSLSVTLSDNVPAGAPDGLSVDTTLPASAPDPALFSNSTGSPAERMTLQWFVPPDDAITIQSADLVLATDPPPVAVPLPPLALAALAAVLGWIAAQRGPGQTRRRA